jgi:predicted esterase
MFLAVAVTASLLSVGAYDPEFLSLLKPMEFRYTGGEYHDRVFPYRLMDPRTTTNDNQRFPLILWLHGLGEAGADNIAHLRHIDKVVLPAPWKPGRFKFFFLALQCPKENSFWFRHAVPAPDDMLSVVVPLLDQTLKNYPIDRDRVYLAGISSGGRACWRLAELHPDYFASVTPMSSIGFTPTRAQVASFKQLPIWVFNCVRDQECPIDAVRGTVNTLAEAGVRIHLSEVDGAFRAESAYHNSWDSAFNDHHLLEWTLAQRRGGWFVPAPGSPTWPRRLADFRRDLPQSPVAKFLKSWKWFQVAALGYLAFVILAVTHRVFKRRRQKKSTPASPALVVETGQAVPQ